MNWLRIEGSAYWVVFVAAFLAVSIWESFRPLRPLVSSASRRWSRHALLYAVSAISFSLIVRVSPVFVAIAAGQWHFGILNHARMPLWISFVITVLALDLCHYASHRLFHATEWLWRVHRVHHSDNDFDVSTAVRFHPLEVAGRQLLYLGAIAVLAPPAGAVLVYGLLVAVENLFVHANKSLPPGVEGVLRWMMITPDLHRIHHSEDFVEQNFNFGEVFPWWDRLFGTYAGETSSGSGVVVTGLRELRGVDTLPILYLLTAPFRRLP